MTTSSPTYNRNTVAAPRERTGGSQGNTPEIRYQPAPAPRNVPSGSHMPIDTQIHWTWRNPLNIFPAVILILLALALISLLFA